MAENDTSESFKRQRRNFIAISLFIIFYRTSGLDLHKINILGNEADIQNPSMISGFVFIIFLYYSWRYTNALNNENGIYRYMFSLSSAYNSEVYRVFLQKKATREAKKRGHDLEKNYLEIPYDNERPNYYRALFIGKTLEVKVHKKQNPNEKAINLAPNKPETFSVVVKKGELITSAGKTFFSDLIKNHNFSEYVFPYILAILAVLELFHLGAVKAIADFLIP